MGIANSAAAPDSYRQTSAGISKTPKHPSGLLTWGGTGASGDDNDFVSQIGEEPNARSQAK
jgi:hypothetical protein